MFALSGRTLLHLLLWILVMPLSLVFARLADARANELAAGERSRIWGPVAELCHGDERIGGSLAGSISPW